MGGVDENACLLCERPAGTIRRQHLLKSGHQVRALVRDTNRAAPLAAAGAEIVFADLDSDDLANLQRAHEGIDYVILQLVAGDDGPRRKKKGLRALECIRRERGIK